MTTRQKILLFSGITLAVGTAFYFLYWRTRNAITPADVPVLQQASSIGMSGSTLQSTSAVIASNANSAAVPPGPAGVFSGIVPILTPTTV